MLEDGAIGAGGPGVAWGQANVQGLAGSERLLAGGGRQLAGVRRAPAAARLPLQLDDGAARVVIREVDRRRAAVGDRHLYGAFRGLATVSHAHSPPPSGRRALRPPAPRNSHALPSRPP